MTLNAILHRLVLGAYCLFLLSLLYEPSSANDSQLWCRLTIFIRNKITLAEDIRVHE